MEKVLFYSPHKRYSLIVNGVQYDFDNNHFMCDSDLADVFKTLPQYGSELWDAKDKQVSRDLENSHKDELAKGLTVKVSNLETENTALSSENERLKKELSKLKSKVKE